ncbi:hypothetical protein K504DRAFT_518150 [Pleomassaria siparia CBS 279.74]|uniref:F-box domain-containing protein n=1 Tax=Pleomassaria siparia CBS 279.74 TaxID=1314801 RepID=A0A6G1KMF5_9PLEO|nr:hypothetical protein K504DRAFT_518150 [Pleomassaria siparia CBS 279.74]
MFRTPNRLFNSPFLYCSNNLYTLLENLRPKITSSNSLKLFDPSLGNYDLHSLGCQLSSLPLALRQILPKMDSASSTEDTRALSPSTMMVDRANQPLRFLDLPTELRVQVYEEVLLVGKVFYTPRWREIKEGGRFRDWSRYRKPQVQLLRVCKQIYQEAEKVYLASNLFVLPVRFNCRKPFDMHSHCNDLTLHRERWLFSKVAFQYLKHISVAFDPRAHIPFGTSQDWEEDGDFSQLTLAQWNALHESENQCLRSFRSDLAQRLMQLTSTLNFLELDFTNAFCPCGCCRDLDISGEFLAKLSPVKTSIIGIRNEEEERELLQTWAEDTGYEKEGEEDMVKKYGMTINPKNDSWAEWMDRLHLGYRRRQ